MKRKYSQLITKKEIDRMTPGEIESALDAFSSKIYEGLCEDNASDAVCKDELIDLYRTGDLLVTEKEKEKILLETVDELRKTFDELKTEFDNTKGTIFNTRYVTFMTEKIQDLLLEIEPR